MKVSRRSVQKARVVRTRAEPEVRAAVREGVVSVDVGAAVAKLPAAEQKAAAAKGRVGLTKAANGRHQSVNVKKSPPREPSVQELLAGLSRARSDLHAAAAVLKKLAARISMGDDVPDVTADALAAMLAEYQALEHALGDVGTQMMTLSAHTYLDATST